MFNSIHVMVYMLLYAFPGTVSSKARAFLCVKKKWRENANVNHPGMYHMGLNRWSLVVYVWKKKKSESTTTGIITNNNNHRRPSRQASPLIIDTP